MIHACVDKTHIFVSHSHTSLQAALHSGIQRLHYYHQPGAVQA